MIYDELTFFILKKIFDGSYNNSKINCAKEFYGEKEFTEQNKKNRYWSGILMLLRTRENDLEKEGIIRTNKIDGRILCYINEERFKVIRMKNPFTKKIKEFVSILENKGTCANFEI